MAVDIDNHSELDNKSNDSLNMKSPQLRNQTIYVHSSLNLSIKKLYLHDEANNKYRAISSKITAFTKQLYLFLTSNNKYALLILYFLALMAIAGNILFVFYLSQSWQESVLIITSILAGFLLLLFLLDKSGAVIRLLVNIWRLWVEVDAREQVFSELVDNKRDLGWALLSVAILIFLFSELITPHYLVNLLRILVGN